MTSTFKPVIGISCCLRLIPFGDYPPAPHHVVFAKYVDYVVNQLSAFPVLLPATPELVERGGAIKSLVSRLDGLLLTGSPSNVGVR